MIASLMMYQRPELVKQHHRYWSLIRRHLAEAGIQSPEMLSQSADEFEVWKHESLVLSQTCGMPYRLWLHDKVSLVGTPDFGVHGCAPGYYCSAIIVHKDDPRMELDEFREAVFAYNQDFSQSGYAAPYWHIKPYGFWFEKRLQTGQHLESARAVSERRADIAAIDAVSWRLMQRYESFVENLRVLEWTTPTPGLPYIAAKDANIEATFNAVEKAIKGLSDEDREALGIRGLVKIPEADYLAVPNPV